jgi:TonB family protein
LFLAAGSMAQPERPTPSGKSAAPKAANATSSGSPSRSQGEATCHADNEDCGTPPAEPSSQENNRQTPGCPAGETEAKVLKSPYELESSCASAPRVRHRPEPEYSEKARRAKLQGTVVLQCIVGVDGHVSQIEIKKPLGMGLDEQAVKAIQKWTFEPARHAGQPVPVLVSVEVNFRL